MKAIVNTGPGQLTWQDLPVPEPGAHQVLVRTGACGICATDIKMIAGWDRTEFPAIPGHEWSGTVARVGSGVDPALTGCRCVGENVWADGKEVGFEYPGGYGEYFVTEASKIHTLPATFPFELGALIEPLAVAVHGTRRLRIEDKSCALVLGDGIIGLMFLAILRRAGIRDLVLVGSRPARLHLARELGASLLVNYHEVGGDLAGAVRRLYGGPFPNVIEASGSLQALWAGLDVVAGCGHLLLVGDHTGERADFMWNSLLSREIELIASNASAGVWPETVKLATSGELPLAGFVSHCFPATEYAQAIELTRQRHGDVIKVVMQWQQN